MADTLHTYAPLFLPISWKSEQIQKNEDREHAIRSLFSTIDGVDVEAVEWPFGYGSLDHDNLPLFYQPAAKVRLPTSAIAPTVIEATLYLYDNYLGVLHTKVAFDASNALPDDLAVSQLIESYSHDVLAPMFRGVQANLGGHDLIEPQKLGFSKDPTTLTSASPLWVARLLCRAPETSKETYSEWLHSEAVDSETLVLGTGNYLVNEPDKLQDIHRPMLLAQFHAALIAQIETLLEVSLTAFNSSYFTSEKQRRVKEELRRHQYRNDHIQFILIQFSSANEGTQGFRRDILRQLNEAWATDQQEKRILRLESLVQERLNRQRDELLREQSRWITALLVFMSVLTIFSLMVDLSALDGTIEHSRTTGILDVFRLFSAEHILSLTMLLVMTLTFYIYRNHD